MRTTLPSITALVTLAAAQHIPIEKATCPCGHTVNATGSEDGWALFTEYFETDFLHIHDLKDDDNSTWIPQAYNVTAKEGSGPYGKASMVENVVMNPLGSVFDWSGTGVKGGDPGLQLWVRSELEGKKVPMAEIVSARDDILYGSFRIGMKTTSIAGTCGAFFFYRNDSNEIDMEFLSSQQGTSNRGLVNLVIQSPESADVGYVQPGSSDFDNHTLPFAPSSLYHEYRIDWLPERVDFYADSNWLSTIRTNVPAAPGSIHVSHWSNGNPGWSAGPPTQDAVMSISYIKAYFNSSNEKTTERSLEACRAGEVPDSSCWIPDQRDPPDPGRNGTGRTPFFTPVDTSDGVPSGAGRRGVSWWGVMVIVGMTVALCGHDVVVVVGGMLVG